MPESDDILYNLTNSFHYFLTTEKVKKWGVEKTFLGWYSNPLLQIILGFPDLEELSLPTLALQWVNNPSSGQVFYGGSQGKDYFFTLWGFSGGDTTEAKNKVQRDKLIGDSLSLLEEAAIPVYSWNGATKGAEIGTAQVMGQISAQPIPKSGQTEAEKYRFSITFTVRILETIT
ncbi:MAG: hypothetical protein NTY10_04330 [Candidatus Omnitrophica bacterium]|nr:hypothetical protein [Candidatus Omnitrophota bacterium]